MRALVIDNKAKEDIAKLLKFADENRISKPFLMAAMRRGLSIGENPLHCCCFKDGFKVVLSIEEQPKGWCKHLSVSVDTDQPNKLPNNKAVEYILQEFGMKSVNESYVYIEDSIIPNAVNIISLI